MLLVASLLLGARAWLLGAPGIATRSKDATRGVPGLTTRNKKLSQLGPEECGTNSDTVYCIKREIQVLAIDSRGMLAGNGIDLVTLLCQHSPHIVYPVFSNWLGIDCHHHLILLTLRAAAPEAIAIRLEA